MKITISFKNLEHTEALDQRIKEKTLKLKKYFEGKTDVQWGCYTQGGEHVADVKMVGPQFEYHANASADSMYKTIDLVLGKIETQLKKKKEKRKEHLHKDHFKGSMEEGKDGYGSEYVEQIFDAEKK